MRPLHCSYQQYAWGKLGSSSAVAQIKSQTKGFELHEDQRYAELWMGTHPSGPSYLADNEGTKTKLLSQHFLEHPEQLGNAITSRWEESRTKGFLPYLFKVLSIDKALSIQAHPDKSLAKILHKEKPEHYADDNHKPEMMIAVTDCDALCGFRPVEEMRHLISHAPEFTKVVGKENVDKFVSESSDPSNEKAAVKRLFSLLMRSEPTLIANCIREMHQRCNSSSAGSGSSSSSHDVVLDRVERLIMRLHDQFPGDVGCFVVYFLNDLRLSPGQALFLGPNVPHAYISGNMVECMAASDNTVRAGLTPKFKDVETLCEMLTYHCGEPDWVTPAPLRSASCSTSSSSSSSSSSHVKLYSPPVEEFAVGCITLNHGPQESVITMESCDSASIWLVFSGKGEARSSQAEGSASSSSDHCQQLRRGEIYLLPAGFKVVVKSEAGGKEPLIIWTASANCQPHHHASSTGDVSRYKKKKKKKKKNPNPQTNETKVNIKYY
jgi:mannose-6-phosphate isomerase